MGLDLKAFDPHFRTSKSGTVLPDTIRVTGYASGMLTLRCLGFAGFSFTVKYVHVQKQGAAPAPRTDSSQPLPRATRALFHLFSQASLPLDMYETNPHSSESRHGSSWILLDPWSRPETSSRAVNHCWDRGPRPENWESLQSLAAVESTIPVPMPARKHAAMLPYFVLKPNCLN